MNWNTLLYGEVCFSVEEEHMQYRHRMLATFLVVTMVASWTLALTSTLGLSPLGTVATWSQWVTGLACILLLMFLRGHKSRYRITTYAMIGSAGFAVYVAFINVPQDQLRII
jgi:predicted membrane channel-forming protein YqfA (hemolysin III family)